MVRQQDAIKHRHLPLDPALNAPLNPEPDNLTTGACKLPKPPPQGLSKS